MTYDTCFPPVDDERALEAITADDATLRSGLAEVSRRLGVAGSDLVPLPGGSLPVYAVAGRSILKLYPPFEREGHRREVRVLEILEGRLPVPTPRVEGSGELDGWGYLLMSRLPGRTLDQEWERIGTSDRLRLCAHLGEALAELHGLADPRLSDLSDDWDGFLAAQRQSAARRQRDRGLDPSWVDRIDSFLEFVPLPAGPATSLLHTEVMQEHLMLSRETGRPGLSGLFDFEPAMTGAAEYEFASVGLFVTCGEPALLREVLSAYGYARSEMGEEMQLRFLALTLLHRYADLPWYLERLPPPPGVRTLEGLARHWWRL